MSCNLKDIIENTLEEFCEEFMKNPYLCYTEHGLHALFYSQLDKKLSACDRCYCNCNEQKVCVIQKEYPTEGKVGKSRRQNWDIAVINTKYKKKQESGPNEAWENYKPEFIPKTDWQNLQTSTSTRYHEYDAFKLFAVIEFGLNEGIEHLKDDVDRLLNARNVENKYIVHLYRTAGKSLFSLRDISPKNKKFMTKNYIDAKIKKPGIRLYYRHF